jgi:hypothetical protein
MQIIISSLTEAIPGKLIDFCPQDFSIKAQIINLLEDHYFEITFSIINHFTINFIQIAFLKKMHLDLVIKIENCFINFLSLHFCFRIKMLMV